MLKGHVVGKTMQVFEVSTAIRAGEINAERLAGLELEGDGRMNGCVHKRTAFHPIGHHPSSEVTKVTKGTFGTL